MSSVGDEGNLVKVGVSSVGDEGHLVRHFVSSVRDEGNFVRDRYRAQLGMRDT